MYIYIINYIDYLTKLIVNKYFSVMIKEINIYYNFDDIKVSE